MHIMNNELREKNPVLISGARGQLGLELARLLKACAGPQGCLPVGREVLDITKDKQVQEFCRANQPGAIVNCAAYTAVDKAETEPGAAFAVNEKGAQNLAQAARVLDIPIIHISTDFVFDGSKPGMYQEGDPARPLGVYGQSKLAGEKAVLAGQGKSLVIRTGWLYSSQGANFVQTILGAAKNKGRLRVVADQAGTPTYVPDLAGAIVKILPWAALGYSQVFHYANAGLASWFDFAMAIVKLSRIPCSILPIETHEYPRPAKRPMYSVLNTKKIRQVFGLSIPHWMESLEICMQKIAEE